MKNKPNLETLLIAVTLALLVVTRDWTSAVAFGAALTFHFFNAKKTDEMQAIKAHIQSIEAAKVSEDALVNRINMLEQKAVEFENRFTAQRMTF